MTSQALYRFFDNEGSLLYVGITMNPAARWPKHRAEKTWWHEVETITLETFETRAEVLNAEREAIKTEHPRYNVVHNEEARWVEPAPQTLVWLCVDCGIEVDDGEGSMNLDQLELHQYETASDDWSERLLTPRAVWRMQHTDCVFETDYLYAIGVHQLRTPAGVLAMTAHLMDKNWINATTWQHVLRAAAQGGL